jgi:hypothetical protein
MPSSGGVKIRAGDEAPRLRAEKAAPAISSGDAARPMGFRGPLDLRHAAEAWRRQRFRSVAMRPGERLFTVTPKADTVGRD